MTDSATFTTPEASDEDLGDLLLEVLPPDGTSMGNQAAREALSRAAERQIGEEEYEAVKEKALALGLVRKGRGRGGSIALGEGIEGGGRYEAPATPSGNGQGRAKKEVPAKDFKAWLLPPPRTWDGNMAATKRRRKIRTAEPSRTFAKGLLMPESNNR